MVNRAANLFPELQGQTDQSESTASAQPRNRALNLFSEENPRSTVPGQEPLDFQYRQNIGQTPSEVNVPWRVAEFGKALRAGGGNLLRGASGALNTAMAATGINNQDELYGLIPGTSMRTNPVTMTLAQAADAMKASGGKITERNQPDPTVPLDAPSLGLGDKDAGIGDLQWYLNQTGQQAPLLAVMVGAGLAGGPVAAGFAGAVGDAGPMYEDMVDSGMSPNQAAMRTAAYVPVGSALEAIPFAGYLGKGAGTTGGLLRRMATRAGVGAASEMPTEFLQEGYQSNLQGESWRDSVEAGVQGAAAAGPIGALLGGGSGAMNIGGQNKPNTDVPPAPFKAPTPNDGSVPPAPTAATDPRLARPKNGKADLAGMIENGKITAAPVSDKPVVNQAGAVQDLLAPTGAQLKAAMLEAGFNENVTTLIALENARKGPDAGDVMADAYLKMIAKGIPDDVAYEVIAEPNPDVRATMLFDYAQQKAQEAGSPVATREGIVGEGQLVRPEVEARLNESMMQRRARQEAAKNDLNAMNRDQRRAMLEPEDAGMQMVDELRAMREQTGRMPTKQEVKDRFALASKEEAGVVLGQAFRDFGIQPVQSGTVRLTNQQKKDNLAAKIKEKKAMKLSKRQERDAKTEAAEPSWIAADDARKAQELRILEFKINELNALEKEAKLRALLGKKQTSVKSQKVIRAIEDKRAEIKQIQDATAQPPVEDVVAPEVVAPVDPIAPVDLLAPEPVAEPIAPVVEPVVEPIAPVEPPVNAPAEAVAEPEPVAQAETPQAKIEKGNPNAETRTESTRNPAEERPLEGNENVGTASGVLDSGVEPLVGEAGQGTQSKPGDVGREITPVTAPAVAEWTPSADKEKRDLQRTLLQDHIATKKANRQKIDPSIYDRLAKIEAMDNGVDASPSEAVVRPVFGSPFYETNPKYEGQILPIKINKNTDLDWRFDLAQKFIDELQKKISTALAIAERKIKSTPSQKKAAKAYLDSTKYDEDLDYLSGLKESVQELKRLSAIQKKMPAPAPVAEQTEAVEPEVPVAAVEVAAPVAEALAPTKMDALKEKIAEKKGKNAEKGKGPIREAKGARDSSAFSNMRGQPATRIIKAGGLDQEAFYELQAAGLEVTPWRMNRSGRKKGGGMHPRQHALMFPKEGGMNLDRIAEWLMDNQQDLSFDRTDMDAYGRPTRNATIQWLRENMFSTINTGKYRDRQDFRLDEDYIAEDMAKYELEEAKKSRKPMSMYEFRELMQTAKGKSTGPKQAVPVMDLPAGSQVVIEGDTFTVHDNDETGEINLMNDVVVSVNPEQTIEVDSIKKVADQPEGDPFAFGEEPTIVAENEANDAGPFFNDAETIQTRPVNQDDGVEAPSLFKPEAGQGIKTESAVSRVVESKIGTANPDLPGQMDLTQSEPSPAIKSTIDKQNGKAKNAAPTKIVKTESELPDSVGDEGLLSNDGGGIIAVYHDGTVYFVEDALIEGAKNEGMSVENFTATLWMHEQGVHNGLRGMLGGDPLLLNMLLDGVHRSLGDKKINAGLSEEYHGMPKRVRAEEYIANLGEKIAKGGELTPDQRTVWQKVVDSVRRLLRKVFPKLKYTDREVEMIARKAIEWTLNGEAKVNQRKQGGDTRFALAGHTPKTEAMLNAYRKAAYGKEVRNDTIDLAAQQMGKKLKEDLPVTKDKFVHDSMKQVIGEGVDIARRQGAEKVTADVNKVAGKIMKDEARIPTAATKAVRDVRDFSEKKGAAKITAAAQKQASKMIKEEIGKDTPIRSILRKVWNASKSKTTQALNEKHDAFVAKMKDNATDVAQKQKEMTAFIKDVMHPEDRAIMLAKIKQLSKVKTPEARLRLFNKLIDETEAVMYKREHKRTVRRIQKLATSMKPGKIGKGSPLGKIGVEGHFILNRVKGIMKLTPDEVSKKIEDYMNRDAAAVSDPNKELTDLEVEELGHLIEFGDLKSKTLEHLLRSEESLIETIKTGRSKVKRTREIRKAEAARRRAEVIDEISGRKGVMTEPERIRARAESQKLVTRIKNFLTTRLVHFNSWEYIVDGLTRKSKDTKTFDTKAHDHLVRPTNKSGNDYHDGVAKQLKVVQSAAQEIFGDRAGLRIEEMSAIKGDSGVHLYKSKLDFSSMSEDELYTLAAEHDVAVTYEAEKNGEMIQKYRNRGDIEHDVRLATVEQVEQIPLSEAEAINIWQKRLNPELKVALELSGWTDEAMSEIEAFLPDDAKKWADWQIEYYRDVFPEINSVFKSENFIDLPQVDAYSPLVRDMMGDSLTQGLGQQTTPNASVLSSMMIPRVTNNNPIKAVNANTLLAQAIHKAEHYKSWAKTMRELREVVGNKEFRQTVLDYNGGNKEILQWIDRTINDMARGGPDAANAIETLEKVRANFSAAKLGINLLVPIKQITSNIAFAGYMPTGSWVKGSVEFWKSPIENMKELFRLSQTLRSRYDVGYERDMMINMQKAMPDMLSGMNSIRSSKDWINPIRVFALYRKHAYAFGNVGDGFAIVTGGWPLYNYELNRLMKNGVSREQAQALAIEKFEEVTLRTQQSGRTQDLSSIQKGGTLGRLMTMFITAPMAQGRMALSGALNMAAGRGSQSANIKQIALGWFALPMIYQFVASGFRWDKEDQLQAMATGPFVGVPIARDIATVIARAAITGSVYGMQSGNFILDSGINAARGVANIHNGIKNDDLGENWLAIAGQIGEPINDMFVGAPVMQLKRSYSAIEDIANDETDAPLRRLLGYSESALGNKKKKKSSGRITPRKIVSSRQPNR